MIALAGCGSVKAPPSFEQVKNANGSSDFELLDREGRTLSRVRRDFSQRQMRWVPLADLAPETKKIFLISEDRRFYDHGGIDWKAVAASIWQRSFQNSSRGGSTITMQLARLIDPSIGGGWKGKFLQVRAARMIERSWTKDQIFEAYLNLVPFRGELRGLEAASLALFDKPSRSLFLAESGYLAALLRGPNASRDKVADRACKLAPQVCAQAKNIRGVADSSRLEVREDLAPHFARRMMLQATGMRLESTIDGDLQRFAIEALQSQMGHLANQNVRDGAILVLENKTGNVVAYVGSSGDFSRSPLVDGVQAHRQAGSVLKPFLYGLAFDRGLIDENSWIEDSPVDVVFPNGTYRPLNHDKQFRGWVRAKQALGSSLNVPAVKTLRLLNDESFWRLLRDLGVGPLLTPDEYGPALALGVADLNLWDLAHAYRALANGGANPEEPGKRFLKAETVKTLERILSDKENREAGFGWSTVLETGFPVAAKTGTSKDMRDNWCFGWGRDYTIGVWTGNFEGDPMWDVSGVTGAAPIWARLFQWLHEHRSRQGLDVEIAPAKLAKTARPLHFPRAKIVYPVEGLVLAVDPEIPEKAQRLPLMATPGFKNLHWRVDGKSFSRATQATWPLKKGRHKISLTENAKLVDQIEIVVK